MCTLPSLARSMVRTRPMGKPENVMSMPTLTPSESSATSTSRCVASNAPRAYSRYSTEPTMSAAVKNSSTVAFSRRCATGGRGWAVSVGGSFIAVRAQSQ